MSEKRIGDVISAVKIKSDGIAVSFERHDKIVLSPESFTDLRLYEGKVLTFEEIEELNRLALSDKYYLYGLRLLGKEARSVRETKTKILAKGADEETTALVIERLKKAGLLNDVTFAETFQQDIGDLRLYGKNKILFELRLKGIPPYIIEKLEFPEEKELDKAFRYASYLNRKYVKSPSEKKIFQAISSLIARGFDEQIAEKAVDACVSPNDEESERKLLERYYGLAKAKYARKYGGYQLKEKIFIDLRKKGFATRDIKEILSQEDDDI